MAREQHRRACPSNSKHYDEKSFILEFSQALKSSCMPIGAQNTSPRIGVILSGCTLASSGGEGSQLSPRLTWWQSSGPNESRQWLVHQAPNLFEGRVGLGLITLTAAAQSRHLFQPLQHISTFQASSRGREYEDICLMVQNQH